MNSEKIKIDGETEELLGKCAFALTQIVIRLDQRGFTLEEIAELLGFDMGDLLAITYIAAEQVRDLQMSSLC